MDESVSSGDHNATVEFATTSESASCELPSEEPAGDDTSEEISSVLTGDEPSVEIDEENYSDCDSNSDGNKMICLNYHMILESDLKYKLKYISSINLEMYIVKK